MTTNSREYSRKYYAEHKEMFREASKRYQEKKKLEKLVIEELNRFLSLQLNSLNRKLLNKHIDMIYVIDKNNIKIKFKKV